MDAEKQKQRRCNDTRLTKSRNARSKQLLVMPTESLTNRELLLGELLSKSECQRPGWFIDMKYQTCLQVMWQRQNFSKAQTCTQQRVHNHNPIMFCAHCNVTSLFSSGVALRRQFSYKTSGVMNANNVRAEKCSPKPLWLLCHCFIAFQCI